MNRYCSDSVLEVKMDVSHFNALLKVYLENDFNFSPNDILAEMEKTKCEPNRVTYQRLIRQHCKVGDMDGATRVLEYMRDKELPITVSIFNALILGHSNVKYVSHSCHTAKYKVLPSTQFEKCCEQRYGKCSKYSVYPTKR